MNSDKNNTSFSSTENWKEQLTVVFVDDFVQQLIKDLGGNPEYRRWYCKLVYTFGPQQVQTWYGRVRDAQNPAMLFSKIAGGALRQHENKQRIQTLREAHYGR